MKIAIGVMPEPLLRKRVIAIAQGKYKPAEDEPKVWCTSLNAVSQVLNPENIALLRLIETEKPENISALAAMSGRKKSNLSNTLKSLCEKGFARLDKGQGRNLKPVVLHSDFEIVISKEIEDRLSALEQDAA